MSRLRDALPESLKHYAPQILGGLILLLVFAALYGWRVVRQPSNDFAFPPVNVSAYTVQPEDVPQSLETVATLQAVNEVNLATEVAGTIVAIHFDAGTTVKSGAPLVQLFDDQDRADKAAASAKTEFARLQLARAKELVSSGNVSRQVLQQREAELAQAQAEVRQAEARLTQRNLRAPFAGEIGIRRVQLGQYVNAGDTIASLADVTRLYVNFTVPQQDLGRLRVGGKVAVRADAFPDRTFIAEINAIDPVVTTDTRNVYAQATLANPDKLLRPGMYVTASIALPPRIAGIVVPATAILTTASGSSVYVIRDGKAEAVAVHAGQRLGERVVIDSGLKAGDVIVALGQIRLQPNTPVNITETYAAPKGR